MVPVRARTSRFIVHRLWSRPDSRLGSVQAKTNRLETGKLSLKQLGSLQAKTHRWETGKLSLKQLGSLQAKTNRNFFTFASIKTFLFIA